MRRLTYGGLATLANVALLCTASQAFALRIMAPPPIGDRVARATTVVTGKVTSVEEKTVKVAPFPGSKDKVEYIIAVVKIDDAIQGAKGLTHVKVAFQAPQAGGPGRPIIRPGFGPQVKLEKDQEVLLFLTSHHGGEFELLSGPYDVVDKKAETMEKDVESAKKAVKILAEPEKALKVKDATERLEAASLVVTKFRTPPMSDKEPKEAAIDADLSKLIMNTLADADWTPPKPRVGGPGAAFYQVTPINVFFRLGVNDKDGFKPPMDGAKFNDYVEKWVKDNKDKYRIKQFVAEKQEKKEDKKGK
jgi:hypothetical protein